MELKAEHLYFRYSKKTPWVLEDVNLSIHSGERVGLIAPSGYGKSTLAMLLAGFYQPTSGSVLLDGNPLPLKGVCPVQMIYQHPEKTINPRWKLHRVLEEAGIIHRDLLSRLGIETEWLARYPRELSGGELQRFCVARALSSNPSFLICDEISTMLDVITQAQIWHQISEIALEKNMGLLVITHNASLAQCLCTTIFDLAKESSKPDSNPSCGKE